MNNYDENPNVYCSCIDLESFQLNVSTHIGYISNCLSTCCLMSMYNNAAELTDDPKESLNNFIEFRRNMIEENKRVYQTDNKERVHTNLCVNCSKYVVKEWETNTSEMSFVSLAVGPSPCQSKCIYCGHIQYDNIMTDKSIEGYEKLFKLMKYSKDIGIINDKSIIQIASGEITIHPYKDKMIEMVDGFTTLFLSNCFKFDQGIADHLKSNPHSRINLSIDSGTAITWKKVKGFNNFNTVLNNLRKYYNYCDQVNHQQIELKYIILPGINTRMQDYLGVINIMKELNVKKLIISKDLRTLSDTSSSEYQEVIDNIIKLAILCVQHGLTYELHNLIFSDEQLKYVNDSINKNERV